MFAFKRVLEFELNAERKKMRTESVMWSEFIISYLESKEFEALEEKIYKR